MSVHVTGVGAVFAKDGSLPELKRKDVFDWQDQRFGRLDHFSKIGLAATAYALQDAGLDKPKDSAWLGPDSGPWKEKRDVGLIASTTYGCLHTDIEYFTSVLPQRGLSASPHLFAYTLPSTFLGEAAIRFGLRGPSFVVNEHHASNTTHGLEALRQALEIIQDGECASMLAGACDPGSPALFGAATDSKELAHVDAGAVILVLENWVKGQSSGRKSYGAIELTPEGSLVFRGTALDGMGTFLELSHA